MLAAAEPVELLVVPFDILMHLARSFHQKEQSARNEYKIAPGEVVCPDREDRRGEMNEPGNAAKHDDAENERERQADATGPQALLRRHARDHDRDEHDVVDAEHDLHRAQGNEARPDMGIGQPLEHSLFPRIPFWWDKRPAPRSGLMEWRSRGVSPQTVRYVLFCPSKWMTPTPVRHEAVAVRRAFTQSGEGKGLATAPIAATAIMR